MRLASFQEIIFSFLFFLINDILLMLFLHKVPKNHSVLWAQTKKRIYRIRLTLTKMSKGIEKHLYLNKCFSLIG